PSSFYPLSASLSLSSFLFTSLFSPSIYTLSLHDALPIFYTAYLFYFYTIQVFSSLCATSLEQHLLAYFYFSFRLQEPLRSSKTLFTISMMSSSATEKALLMRI